MLTTGQFEGKFMSETDDGNSHNELYCYELINIITRGDPITKFCMWEKYLKKDY